MTLKEIKTRIQSVKSTQKITSAMKMISSAKLRKAERKVLNFVPYQQKMNEILNNYLSSATADETSVFAQKRDVQNTGIVVFASNSSLCGAYNSTVIKRLEQSLKTHRSRRENVFVFPVGKKIRQACERTGIKPAGVFDTLAENPDYEQTAKLAEMLMQMFVNHDIDRVKLIYFHYESKGHQTLQADTFLPVELNATSTGKQYSDYIIEPSREQILNSLIPKVLCSKMYAAALDACTSEQAARLLAMQTATDNADDLLQELSIQYNKSRQQAITAELLDIAGGKTE
ncbi:MAG: ATP synthase F1 subunit gamma [Paludibacter sp.]|jgi:F-type H+-transporting ATPase subunit gamma|nr:ATP synthase F1 subunit gamma [Paludibacter sp.]